MDAVVVKRGVVSFEISPMVFAVRLYDADNPTDYTSSFQCFKYGDVAMVYSITGAGFYRLIPVMLGDVFNGLQVTSLQGYVTKAHRRAMAHLLRGVARVEVLWSGECAGREMVWVRVALV